jgi:ppGpp synthetase/RelA/SpoT-type nucleotidyltranferase
VSAASISERYFQELPRLKVGLRISRLALEAAAKAVDPAAVVTGRVKTHRSVMGKIYRKSPPRTWDSIGDLVALKAVFPTERGVTAFTEWICAQEAWSPKLDPKPSRPDELKYSSMQLDLECDELCDSKGAPLKIELQVRSAVVDAWYIVDHRLRYKGMVSLPDDLERKLLRLIVLTELFDEEVASVISKQVDLPEYAAARLYDGLVREFDDLTGGYAKTSRPEGLLEVILMSYKEDEIPNVETAIPKFVEDRRAAIRAVIADHLHESLTFVESRDWLYYEPEALLIAERACNRPALIRKAILGSDFEPVVEPMISEFRQRLL